MNSSGFLGWGQVLHQITTAESGRELLQGNLPFAIQGCQRLGNLILGTMLEFVKPAIQTGQQRLIVLVADFGQSNALSFQQIIPHQHNNETQCTKTSPLQEINASICLCNINSSPILPPITKIP